MRYKYLFIDAQNLYWRSVVSVTKELFKNEDTYRKFHSEIIQNFLSRINQLRERFGITDNITYLLFDNSMSKINERKLISLEYKHAREKRHIPSGFYKILDICQNILIYYSNNLFLCKYNGFEADDLVLPLKKSLSLSITEKLLLISADLDWAREIDVNTHWYNFVDVFDELAFKDKYNFYPKGNAIKLFKSFRGDTSDNIENAVPYLPTEILISIVEKYSSIDEIMNDLWTSTIPKQWRIKIKEAENKLKSNYLLVDFIELNAAIEEYCLKCSESLKALRHLFDVYRIPLENRLFDKKKDKFFSKKNYTRIK